jgi:hypothetical protein
MKNLLIDGIVNWRRPLWGIAAALGATILAAGCGDTGPGALEPSVTEPSVTAPSVPAPSVPEPVSTAAEADTSRNGVAVQLLTKPDVSGNARVTITNFPTSSQTKPPVYLEVGIQGNPIILRDDGVGADLVAGDHVYSTFAFVKPSDLNTRNANEVSLIDKLRIQSAPVFSGRVLVGQTAAVPFDVTNFNNHNVVAINPSVIVSPAGTSPAGAPSPGAPAPASSLVINDPGVVGDGDPTRTFDPCTSAGTELGAFTFGHLMTEMANQPLTGIDPSDFVMQWLKTWEVDQTVNGFTVPARPNIDAQIINPWLAASGGVKLNLGIAPFRLLAIVNRLDLRAGAGGYGGATGNAGEARFVFGAVVPGPTCQLLPFTVIFEYGVPISGCTNVKTWAQEWVNLSSLTVGTEPYNAALQAITDQFVLRNAAPGKPNGSALNQLRTNEIALSSPWELRQFNLLFLPGDFLHEAPVFNTPDNTFNAEDPNWNFSTTVDSFIMTEPPIAPPPPSLATPVTVPLLFGGAAFLGGSALVPPLTAVPNSYFWNGSTLTAPANQQRATMSLNTCNGCHAGETNTFFTHISPTTGLGVPAALSGFLTGETVVDPAFGTPTRTYNEFLRRQVDLQGVANRTCMFFPLLDPTLVAAALAGKPVPPELAAQPIAPVLQQGTFFIEDFFKSPIQGH